MSLGKNTIQYIKGYWNGEIAFSYRTKFNSICVALGIAHVLYCLLFFILEYNFIAIYNVVSAVLFLFTLPTLIYKEKYYLTFIIAYSEILIYSCMVTFMCGWDWGFMMYAIAISPVSFFITYSMPGLKRTMTQPTLFTLLSMIIFMLMKVYSRHMNEVHLIELYDTSSHSDLVIYIYMANVVLSFLAIIIFSVLFAMEVRIKEIELEKKNRSLTDISSLDPLTGLLNRRSMGECLDTAVEHIKKTGELFSLAIGDIDNFKKVNDVYGHNVGDDILVMVSQTIRENLPEKAILCRWGGEEFLILLRCPEAEAIPALENIRRSLTRKYTKVDRPGGYINLGVTMTFGVSQYVHGYTIDQVVSLADENLYRGKEGGKNRVVGTKTVV